MTNEVHTCNSYKKCGCEIQLVHLLLCVRGTHKMVHVPKNTVNTLILAGKYMQVPLIQETLDSNSGN